MRIEVITLFPEMFQGFLSESLLGKAIERGLVQIVLHNLRDWSKGKHHQVDDRPYGGGPGMVLMVEPLVECVEAVRAADPRDAHLVFLTPQGRTYHQTTAEEFSNKERLILVCGRYEGFDQRAIDLLQPDEVSLGDFVLNGGETAAMVVIDSVCRLLPGVLGDESSSRRDSFSSDDRLLEYPQYTRPPVYRGLAVPEILLSGNHQAIEAWRRQKSLEVTRAKRPDLLGGASKEALSRRPSDQ
jgi:tRNA (guanine37-N1)-methyltransferase